MTPNQKQYFDSMKPGQMITPDQVKDWSSLIQAGKEYIDQGGMITFNDDYQTLTKCNPIPTDDRIRILISQ